MQSYWKIRKLTRVTEVGRIQIVNGFLFKTTDFNIGEFANENSKIERTEGNMLQV